MILLNYPKAPLPEYHDGMLIMKVRPTVRGAVPAAATSFLAASTFVTPGLAAVSTLERAGLIKRMTHWPSRQRRLKRRMSRRQLPVS